MLVFLKNVYRVFRCIREFVMSLFFILFVLFVFSIWGLLSEEPTSSNQSMPFDKGALRLNLDGYLADNHDDFGDFRRFVRSEFGSGSEPVKISTFDVVSAIRKATYDDAITGLVLDLSFFEGGDQPSLEFIGKAITDFKAENKLVIAIGDYFSQRQYFLASFADKILLNKAGFVDLHGMSYETVYFKTLLDKIEAVPHIFRVGTYKSAVEPFIRDDMSPEAKENATLWLSAAWQNFKNGIATNRQIDPESIVPEPSKYIAQFKEANGDDAQFALSRQLVTELATNAEIHQMLIDEFGRDPEGDYNYIDFFDYVSHLPDRFNVNGPNKIAVVNVEGAIVLGDSDEDSAGSDTIVRLLREAKEDENVKGLILRINSPGGSAMASELIRQEVESIQKSGKPVIASMGGMAASGGYWIAATSDKIVASPTTLTGSIGIFGLAVTFENTAKKLGLSQDGVSTSSLASQSLLKTLPREQAELMQISIESGYDRFLDLVSRGRHMSKSDVDKVAQGQVWLGEVALDKGLVDKLGDFDDAYNEMVTLINQHQVAEGKDEIDNFATQWFIYTDDSFFGQVMRDFKMNMKTELTQLLNLPLASQVKQQADLLSKFNDPKQSYLYCLNCGTIN
ncbi:signal peptide peptidase SppA [Otariodibacter oris]|uniref:Protease-4 n=1 Tax=Otariodibacter oris TaxID=1032623 RepID=A0A420XHI5_9PAST|nr:signal peptide peptidase SppA [Otariodibacter oris]QGM81008.1 signal peptide peptidase SppA [Otariodibacter oris]RKR76812.1 protease-4 [Otariodibacter oris]